MLEKSVTFSEEISNTSLQSFKTWPRRAIKYTQQKEPCSDQPSSTTKVEQDLSDLYYRFKTLNDVDSAKCLKYIVDGRCDDALLSYSVLNIILKSGASADSDEEGLSSPLDVKLEVQDAVNLLEQASKALTRYRNSSNALDSRILQQILRSVENIWSGQCAPRTDEKDVIRDIAAKCVSLIRQRPSSKLLLGPTVRIINIALTESLLSAEQIKEMIQTFSCARFVFAAGFSAEVMLALTTVSRMSPSILAETAAIWIRMAVRSLIATSAMTRSLALNLLADSSLRRTRHVALALNERCDPERADSDILIKHIVRKFTSMLANVGGSAQAQQEDGKFVLECWSLMLDSVASLPEAWPLLDYLIEIERGAVRNFPKMVNIIWDTILAAQKLHSSFSRLLTPPLLVHHAMGLPISRMVQEAMSKVDPSSESTWDYFYHPILKHLALRKDPLAVQIWSQVASLQPVAERQMSSCVELLSLVTRNLANHHVSACQLIWEGVAKACSTSRQRAMSLIRLHYALYSQASFAPCPFSIPLLNTLMKTWSFAFLTEQHKNTSFNLLTLLFLPIVLFVHLEKKSEYIDTILGNCKSEASILIMLEALLDTVHAGSEDQLGKWMAAGSTIREYLGSNRDPSSVNLCSKALLTFLAISESASASQWAEWQKLFDSSPLGRDKVLAKIHGISGIGLRYILRTAHTPQAEKVRIVVTSLCKGLVDKQLTDSTLELLKSMDPSSEFLDNVARELVAQNCAAAATIALDLVTAKRIFVVAKPLFAAIDQTQSTELVEFWNNCIVPDLHKSPPFVSKPMADRITKVCPRLTIPSHILIPLSKPSTTPSKRPKMETSPSSAKRPRRTILTGSVPTPLSTPPVSSDPAEDLSATNEDLLCSSPPQSARHLSSSDPLPNWRSSQQERARTLKRVMMGLEMDEAVQDMKRSEQEMIYSLMFRSCVKLRTHLAATSKPLEESQVKAASAELEAVSSRHKALQTLEDMMIESGRRRQLEAGSSDSLSDDDSELDEDDAEEVFNCRALKIET